MSTVTCVGLAGGLLLVVAGAAKVVRPRPLVSTMRAVGVPASSPFVRGVAIVEVLVGAWATAVGGAIAWAAVAASYAVLAAFVSMVRRRRGPSASCGCFGERHVPASTTHVAVTAGFAGAAAVAAAQHAPGLVRVGDVAAVVGIGIGSAVVAYLSYAVIAVLPRVHGSGAIRGVN